MNSSILPGRRSLLTLLVVAPLLELGEVLTTPLRDGPTSSELGHIADHQTAFVFSAMCGLAATLLYLPMFLGLAEHCRPTSPRLARTTGWLAAFAMACFVGVRTINAVELQTIRDGLPRRTSAGLVDHLVGNPVAAVVFVVFLGGSIVASISLGILVWRAGLPRPAAVLLLGFDVVDLATGYAGGVVAHVMLVVGLGWIARAIAHGDRRPADADTNPVAPAVVTP